MNTNDLYLKAARQLDMLLGTLIEIEMNEEPDSEYAVMAPEVFNEILSLQKLFAALAK